MSNLKNLKKTIKSISEKKDPILNMYVGNAAYLDVVEERDELFINALFTPGIARITTKEIGKPNFLGNTDYEIIIRKNTNGNRIDVVFYNPTEHNACSQTVERENGVITKMTTSFDVEGTLVTAIKSKTDIFKTSTLNEEDGRYNFDSEPINVVFGVLSANSAQPNPIKPDYTDSFHSSLVPNEEGQYVNKTITTDFNGSFETEAYSLLHNTESVMAAFNEYAAGELRSSTFDIKSTRNK